MSEATLRGVAHPLEPLSPEEIERAVAAVRQNVHLPPRHRFVDVYLAEPPKSVVLGRREGEAIERAAFVVVYDLAEAVTYEGIVSLADGQIRSWDRRTGVQPSITLQEFAECEEACKRNPEFQEALRRRGITDLEQVIVDPWSFGAYEGDPSEGRRLARALTWVRMGPHDEAYAHPVENLVVIVDLGTMEVVRVEDYGVIPVPREPGNYRPEAIGRLRPDLKPLEIRQPEGPSFEVRGHEVRWQKWRFCVGFTPREGLVLHTVTYEDKERERMILYRASLSEMVVPYGDVMPVHRRKNAFDAGEYRIGALANSLELGCDCLGEIYYFNAHIVDAQGSPVTIKNAICMHEEDYGILWKHFDFRLGHTEVRRSRRLVISWIATVANYEYGFFWYLYQDGTIQFEGKLTGIMSTGALGPGGKSKYGQVLNRDGLFAPIHQHFFNFRLDLDVDGPINRIYEVDLVPEEPGPHNPEHNAFYPRKTLLATELEAQRLIDPLRGRYWRIENPDVLNKVGEPVAYRLIPTTSAVLLARPEASVFRRATFATRNLWVTPYSPAERHAAGPYPNQHPGGAGLPEWTRQNRSLVDTDLVLWFTLGAPHVPRLEDWPVMPVEYCTFYLKPDGFFDENPALDVPPSVRANGREQHCRF
ncbi:MAG: primary-amine oxidase [Thermomicrobium sp.]|uniref:primary-amine oxidase n=1 Tax=Thermomicrobium sp. TaxID=1969469 RepID=UPI001AFEF912|nr:primary-amine oxidase [Thermomicrobium sp.]MBO9358929.1 primary-amine oxidase [Thermomicrobium sp.]